jgi:alkaline phosphatase
MKLRNQLLALFCVAAFVAVGYLYVQQFVVQKPFGIILFVSDGLVARQLTMARLFEGGAEHRLALEEFPNVALLRNFANDFAVPDDAAAGTALATGHRGNHRALSVDATGAPRRTIAELARRAGRSVGIVTNGSIVDPLPASFFAHTRDAREGDAIALQFVEQFRPDVAFGGGESFFLPASKGGARKDQRQLIAELQQQGVDYIHSKAELDGLPSYHPNPVLGLFAPKSLPFANQIEPGSRQPSLSEMVRRAIVLLQGSRKGYLLVVDAALVSTAAGSNNGERMIDETLALDRAVETAVKYAGSKSLIVAVGKHSTGGLSLNGYPLRQDRGVALLGANPAGYPYLTWATGPKGPAPAGAAALTSSTALAATPPAPVGGNARNEPAAYQTFPRAE